MPGHAQGAWAFVDDFCAKRRAELEAAPPYAEIVRQLSRSAFPIHHSVELGRSQGLTHCKRPVLRFNVGGDLFDAFFNSPTSYRAQFLIAPERGQAANGEVLNALREQLEAAA